jgi:transposase
MSVILWVASKGGSQNHWLSHLPLLACKPKVVAAVALANKTVRTFWAVQAKCPTGGLPRFPAQPCCN